MVKTASQIQQEQDEIKRLLQQLKDERDTAEYQASVMQRRIDQVMFYENAHMNSEADSKKVDEYLNGANNNGRGALEFTGQEAYKEPSTSIMNLYGSLLNLLRYLVANQACLRIIRFASSREVFGLSADKVVEGLRELGHMATRKVSDSIGKALDGVTPTPETDYYIIINKNGELQTDVIVAGKPLSGDKKASFDKGFAAWLELHDWTLDKKTNIITDSSGEPMTMADFDKLNDSNDSLASFFKNTFDYKITPAVQPQIDDLPAPPRP